MILINGVRYYPLEMERVVAFDGGIIYDREIWKLRCLLLDCNSNTLRTINGEAVLLGGFAALDRSEYISSFSGNTIDEFIDEVLS